jgi:hypothetical protein
MDLVDVQGHAVDKIEEANRLLAGHGADNTAGVCGRAQPCTTAADIRRTRDHDAGKSAEPDRLNRDVQRDQSPQARRSGFDARRVLFGWRGACPAREV